MKPPVSPDTLPTANNNETTATSELAGEDESKTEKDELLLLADRAGPVSLFPEKMMTVSQLPLSPGARLRKSLESGPILIPGVFNALSARMAERAGLAAVYQSGAALSAGLAAIPDIGLLTLTEFAEQAGYLTQAVSIPVLSDADTGFGNALAVQRTVQLYERAGLAGLHLEDQQLPKRCGHLSGKTLISVEEMQGKIRAAVAARRDPDFLLIARIDARGVLGYEETLRRAEAYWDAGADALFPEALETVEEFADFARRFDLPLFANMTEFGKSPLLTVQELGEMGYAAVLFPVTLFRLAMKTVAEALSTLTAEGTQRSLLPQMQSRAELYELLNYEDYEQRDRSFFSIPPDDSSRNSN